MILYASLEDAEAEKAIRNWFEENFGAEDATAIADWVATRERGARYLDILAGLARHYKGLEAQDKFGIPVTEERPSAKQWLAGILSLAGRSRAEREAEMDLRAFAHPLFVRLAKRVLAVSEKDRERAAEEALEEARVLFYEHLRKMWPDKHRVMLNGACVTGLKRRNGKFEIDVRAVVEHLMKHDDPLKVTAASSHG